MSDLPTHELDDEGSVMAAPHREARPDPYRVAATQTDRGNVIRPPLAPIACWRTHRARFETASSIPLPSLQQDLPALRDLAGSSGLLALFGHADPTGADEPNKALSGRRAKAIHALLTRDVDAWLNLARDSTDDWTYNAPRIILRHLTGPAGAPYLSPDDSATALADATRAYQVTHGAPPTGLRDEPTLRSLYRAYMDSICIRPGEQFSLPRSRFLGGGLSGDAVAVQGCGEFNPVWLPGTQLTASSQRLNRRVLAFVFPSSPEHDLSSWPCPRWDEPSAGCRAQFWPDGDARRRPRPELRRYREDRRTMACRFYDRFAQRSPCEGATHPLFVSISCCDVDREGAYLAARDSGHATVHRWPATVALESSPGVLLFQVEPEALPDPVTLVWVSGWTESTVVELTSLSALRRALRVDGGSLASTLAYGSTTA